MASSPAVSAQAWGPSASNQWLRRWSLLVPPCSAKLECLARSPSLVPRRRADAGCFNPGAVRRTISRPAREALRRRGLSELGPRGLPEMEREGGLSVVCASGDGASDVPSFKGFPPMQTRPAWYWRMAAVAPYCLPLLEGWLYSETAITLYPPLFHYKVLCSPIINIFAVLPSWFLLAYFFTAYLGVVRNNRWPHFIRFHVVMGMLMEIILQVVGTVNNWIPASVVWGRFGQHFWLGATMAYIFIVLECILSALKGMYADVPFISGAAYMQIPYE